MIESVVQKFLILTVFFGQAIWKAADELVKYIGKQFSVNVSNGDYWIVGIYSLIYFIGGVCIAFMANNIIKKISLTKTTIEVASIKSSSNKKTNLNRKLTILAGFLVLLSVILFLFAPDSKQGWIAIAKAITWTVTVIIAWYMFINPLLLRFIKSVLQKHQSRYRDEVTKILSFIPVLKGLTMAAWQRSKPLNGWGRMSFFLVTLINWSLTYSEKEAD